MLLVKLGVSFYFQVVTSPHSCCNLTLSVEATAPVKVFEALACMLFIFISIEFEAWNQIGIAYSIISLISVVCVVFKVLGLAPQFVPHKLFKILNFLRDLLAHFLTYSEKQS